MTDEPKDKEKLLTEAGESVRDWIRETKPLTKEELDLVKKAAIAATRERREEIEHDRDAERDLGPDLE